MNLVDIRPDNLEPLLDSVRSIAEGYQLKLISGWLSDVRYAPQVNWQFEGVRSLQEFLGFAAQSQTGYVVVDPIRVTRGDLEAVFDRPAPESLKDRMKLTGRVGQLALLRLLFVSDRPATVHSLEVLADWYAFIFPEDHRACAALAGPELTTEEMTEGAERLARDPRFQEATGKLQREFVARKVFAAELKHDEMYPVEEIALQATQLYETELRPEIEARLAEEAQRLLDEGISRGDIARRLNLSLFRLSRLI